MEKHTKVAHYIRKNRIAKAVIYVRGHREQFQEMMCRLYAKDKGYDVAYVTRNLEDVKLCDVLLVANPSRISRDKIEYCKIVKELNENGIAVESAIEHDNAHEYVSFLMYILNEKDDKIEKC